MVAFCATHEEVLKKIRKTGYKLNQEEINALKRDSAGRTTMLMGGQVIIQLANYPKPGSPVLAHEVFHTVFAIMDRIGIPLSNDSDEAYAYLVQFLTKELGAHI